jgi:hypothetical protein
MPLRRIILLSTVLALGGATTATAQTLASDVQQDWQVMKQIMLGIADAMPEDGFDYASTPEQRTFGEQILHVAGGNVFLMGFLGAEADRPAIDPRNTRTFGHAATSKAEILEALSDSFDYGTAALDEFDDEALVARVDGPPFLAQTTRLRLAYFVIGHAWDIYGQMAVYLRLNGIVPPASRGGV